MSHHEIFCNSKDPPAMLPLQFEKLTYKSMEPLCKSMSLMRQHIANTLLRFADFPVITSQGSCFAARLSWQVTTQGMESATSVQLHPLPSPRICSTGRCGGGGGVRELLICLPAL